MSNANAYLFFFLTVEVELVWTIALDSSFYWGHQSLCIRCLGDNGFHSHNHWRTRAIRIGLSWGHFAWRYRYISSSYSLYNFDISLCKIVSSNLYSKHYSGQFKVMCGVVLLWSFNYHDAQTTTFCLPIKFAWIQFSKLHYRSLGFLHLSKLWVRWANVNLCFNSWKLSVHLSVHLYFFSLRVKVVSSATILGNPYEILL